MKKNILALALLVTCLSACSDLHAMDDEVMKQYLEIEAQLETCGKNDVKDLRKQRRLLAAQNKILNNQQLKKKKKQKWYNQISPFSPKKRLKALMKDWSKMQERRKKNKKEYQRLTLMWAQTRKGMNSNEDKNTETH